jgi:hypothetical protein
MIVEAVITTGRSLPWKARDDRELRIDVAGIEARIDTGIPVLHRHSWEASTLGYLDDAWIEDGSLKGALVLTGKQGRALYRKAMRGEFIGVSSGIEVLESTEERGLHSCFIRTFTARRCQLTEVSITPSPADSEAFVMRVLDDDEIGATRYRMAKLHRKMLWRQLDTDDGDDVDDGLIAVRMPPVGVVQYGRPEPLIRSTMVRSLGRDLIRFMPGE